MGSGGQQSTSSSTKVEYTPEEMAARQNVWNQASNLYDQSMSAIQNGPAPVSAPAGQSADTLAGQEAARSWATGGQTQIANQLPGAIQYGLNGAMDVQNNPYLQSAIQAAIRPVTNNLNEQILPGVRADAMASGGYGGTRAGIAEGLAMAKANQSAQDTAAQMASQAYQTGQDTFSKTLAFLPQASSVGTMPSQILSGIGAQNENYQQELNDYQANLAQYNQTKGWGQLGNLASAIYGGIQPGTTTTTTGAGTNKARSALTGAASGAALGTAIMPGIGTAVGAIGGGIMGLL